MASTVHGIFDFEIAPVAFCLLSIRMETKTEEQHLIATSRNYWDNFQMRLAHYGGEEKKITVKALFDCCESIARRFGHSPEHYIFGNGDFTPADLTAMFANYRILRDHTRRQGFHEGETAIAALRAISALEFVKLVGTTASARQLAESQLDSMRTDLSKLVAEYFTMTLPTAVKK